METNRLGRSPWRYVLLLSGSELLSNRCTFHGTEASIPTMPGVAGLCTKSERQACEASNTRLAAFDRPSVRLPNDGVIDLRVQATTRGLVQRVMIDPGDEVEQFVLTTGKKRMVHSLAPAPVPTPFGADVPEGELGDGPLRTHLCLPGGCPMWLQAAAAERWRPEVYRLSG
jgi:hypothetical protein